MTNEEIVTEIEESIKLINQTKTTVNDALCHARNVVEKNDKAIEEVYNKGLEDGRNEAWELARKIFTTDCATLQKAFGHSDEGTIIMMFKPQKVLELFETYYKELTEIKVGDVVEAISDGKQYLVITEEIDNSAYDFGVIDLNEMIIDRICNDTRCFKKTGKHIDITSVLKQIGDNEDEKKI